MARTFKHRLTPDRRKHMPNLSDFVVKGCHMFRSPLTADTMIDMYFTAGKNPCKLCDMQCSVFKRRCGDRRKAQTTN